MPLPPPSKAQSASRGHRAHAAPAFPFSWTRAPKSKTLNSSDAAQGSQRSPTSWSPTPHASTSTRTTAPAPTPAAAKSSSKAAPGRPTTTRSAKVATPCRHVALRPRARGPPRRRRFRELRPRRRRAGDGGPRRLLHRGPRARGAPGDGARARRDVRARARRGARRRGRGRAGRVLAPLRRRRRRRVARPPPGPRADAPAGRGPDHRGPPRRVRRRPPGRLGRRRRRGAGAPQSPSVLTRLFTRGSTQRHWQLDSEFLLRP